MRCRYILRNAFTFSHFCLNWKKSFQRLRLQKSTYLSRYDFRGLDGARQDYFTVFRWVMILESILFFASPWHFQVKFAKFFFSDFCKWGYGPGDVQPECVEGPFKAEQLQEHGWNLEEHLRKWGNLANQPSRLLICFWSIQIVSLAELFVGSFQSPLTR